MKLFTTANEINAAIAAIQKDGKKLDLAIQHCALSILGHIEAHGDTTLADKLIKAMPKGARVLALVEWMLAYGMVTKLDPKATQDVPAIAAGRFLKIDRTRVTDLVGAAAKPWFEFKKEKPVLTAFDAQAEVGKLLARLTSASTKGMEIMNKGLALEAAMQLVAALSAEEAPAAEEEEEGQAEDLGLDA